MFNVKVQYEDTPIRHIAVQCPNCNKWFRGWDIVKGDLRYAYQINFAEFTCPICNEKFGGIQHADKPNIKKSAYPEIYEACVKKKEVWE